MSSTVQETESGGHYAPLTRAIECAVQNLYDLIPKLQQAGFDADARQLRTRLSPADSNITPLYSLDALGTDEIRKRFDSVTTALARSSSLLYQLVEEKCSFGEHHELLSEIRNIMRDFQKHASPKLRVLDLDYYEFKSLELEVEAKLGIGTGHADDKPHERRRRLPKDPDKIEAALMACLDSSENLRSKIQNPEREAKLDQLLGKVRGILGHLPEGDDETSRGKRVGKLVSAAAIIMKVSKWIKKVDLLETEQSTSKREAILRQFDNLAALATGHELGNGRA